MVNTGVGVLSWFRKLKSVGGKKKDCLTLGVDVGRLLSRKWL